MAPPAAMAWSIFELARGMVGRWGFLGVEPFSHRYRGVPPPLLVGVGDNGTWEQLGWVGKAEAADNGTAGGDGMSNPHFEEDNPNHSSSYVNFSVFSNFLR
jgi:hypothetical protein